MPSSARWPLLGSLLALAHSYGEGFGLIDAPAANHSHCPAGVPRLSFAAPTPCTTLLVTKGNTLDVPVRITVAGVSVPPCVTVQVRSSTQHAWFFMIPPSRRHDIVRTVCATAAAAAAAAAAVEVDVTGGTATVATTRDWTIHTSVRLGAGFHRLGARLDVGGVGGAAAHTARWGAHAACAHEVSELLHISARSGGRGDTRDDAAATAEAEQTALRETVEKKHVEEEAEAAAARNEWRRLAAEYKEVLRVAAESGGPGAAAAAAARAEHAALSSIHTVLGDGVLHHELRDALLSGEPARLAALMYEVPLGQQRDGTFGTGSALLGGDSGGSFGPVDGAGRRLVEVGSSSGGVGSLFSGGASGVGGAGGAGGSNIFTFPVFSPRFGMRLARVIDEAKARFGSRMSAPNNGGAGFGFVLDEFGLGGLAHALAREVLAPLGRLAYPAWGAGTLDGYHAFSIRVVGGESEAKWAAPRGTHIDVCEVSMNICFGRDGFRGSGMSFGGEDVGGAVADDVPRTHVEHVPGRGILNVCQHHHAGSGTLDGERYSLVVRGTSAAFRRSPAESFAARCLDP